MKPTVRIAIFAGSSILISSTIFAVWYWCCSPNSEFKRLLAGNNDIEIKSLTIKGQGLKIELDDPMTMKYLTRSFRGASKGRAVDTHGYTYYAYVKLGSGALVMVGCDTPDEGNGAAIAFPYYSTDDPPYYWISFPQPLPPALVRMISQMRKPNFK